MVAIPVSEASGPSPVLSTILSHSQAPSQTQSLSQASTPSEEPQQHLHAHAHQQHPYHRPAFVHASTSFGPMHQQPHMQYPEAPQQSRSAIPSRTSTPHQASYYPSEKDSPPPEYDNPYAPHLSQGSGVSSPIWTRTDPFAPHALHHHHLHQPHQPHQHAGPSQSRYQPDSRRGSSTDRRAVAALADSDSSVLQCVKSKLMGKEGGMGRALMLGWVGTTLGFLIATAFWRGELFSGKWSHHLSRSKMYGRAVRRLARSE